MLRNPKQLKYISPLSIPEGKSGHVKIGHAEHPAKEPVTVVSTRTAIFAGQTPLRVSYNEPVTYTILGDKDGTWMTDTPAEQVSAHDALKKCKGRVLVGGLGLGYFIKKLQEKNNVSEVIVIEISQDVINLVWKHLNLDKRFSVICIDIKKYLKRYTSNRKFDWVYLDIWRGDGEASFIDTVLPLKRLAYKTACDKVNHILSWQEDVMLGQIWTGLYTQIQSQFDETKSMPDKKFNETFGSKYLITRKVFWTHIREYQLSSTIAMSLIPMYIVWIRNGMQENGWEI